jgi:hypothetical protein
LAVSVSQISEKQLVVYVSQISEEQLLYTITQFRIWQFQTTAQTQYFHGHLLALTIRLFGGEHRGFLKEGVKTY